MIKSRVLILGGNGFIGRNLCDFFHKKNWIVTSFDIEKPEDFFLSIITYISGMTDKFAIDTYNEIIGF